MSPPVAVQVSVPFNASRRSNGRAPWARKAHAGVMGDRTLTVGVLTPHVTAGPEIEIPVMSAGHVATVVSRIPLPARSDAGATSPQSLREGARPSALDEAAKAFPHGSVDALAYASTSELGATYFRARGFDALASRADTPPDDPAQVRPGPVADWACRHVSDGAEAIF